MKKKVIIISSCILAFLIVSFFGLFIYYESSLNNKGKDEEVTLVIEQGTSVREIVDSLYDAKLLKNKYCGYIYMKLHKDLNLQAGIYGLNRNMSFVEIVKSINDGNVVDDSISVMFVEGMNIRRFVWTVSEYFDYSEDDVYKVISSEDYLKQLIEKYWFLTDEILDDRIYYPLEGYLYPDTYQFAKDVTIEQIVERLLNKTDEILSGYKELIEKSEYTVHQMLTVASMTELEGSTNDRANIASVFYNRLKVGMSLGSDVTTYYGVKVDMSERELYQYEIDASNDYNTRNLNMGGKLPVSPVCNPGKISIEASIDTPETDYLYFVADKTGKTYFSETYEQHNKKISELKSNGLWYDFE